MAMLQTTNRKDESKQMEVHARRPPLAFQRHASGNRLIEAPPLLQACKQGCYGVVYSMITKPREKDGTKVDLNETDLIGHAPLETAISLGHVSIAKLLIQHGADIEYSRRYDGCTPLHSAVIHGQVEIVKLILSRRDSYGSINQAADNGFTALHIACSNSNEEIVSLLLEEGASVEARDARGWTPLFLAAWRGRAETIRKLIEHGADANASDMDDQTPLSVAGERGNAQAFLVLLCLGAQVSPAVAALPPPPPPNMRFELSIILHFWLPSSRRLP